MTAPTPPVVDPVNPPAQQVTPPDPGFPEHTALAEMTEVQRAAYFRHQANKTTGMLAAFKGVTPQNVEQMQAELDSLRNEKLTADEKAVREASAKAAADAKTASDKEWQPKYQAAQLKSAAATILTDKDQLTSFMAMTDPSKFAGADGEIDEEMVMGHLTALFGAGKPAPPAKPPAWGQHSGGTPPARPGESGRAEAAKRFGTKTT